MNVFFVFMLTQTRSICLVEPFRMYYQKKNLWLLNIKKKVDPNEINLPSRTIRMYYQKKMVAKSMVAEPFGLKKNLWLLKFQEENIGEKCIVADFFKITNFCRLWLLKFQEENIGIKMYCC